MPCLLGSLQHQCTGHVCQCFGIHPSRHTSHSTTCLAIWTSITIVRICRLNDGIVTCLPTTLGLELLARPDRIVIAMDFGMTLDTLDLAAVILICLYDLLELFFSWWWFSGSVVWWFGSLLMVFSLPCGNCVTNNQPKISECKIEEWSTWSTDENDIHF